jgi:hypothetical protein
MVLCFEVVDSGIVEDFLERVESFRTKNLVENDLKYS